MHTNISGCQPESPRVQPRILLRYVIRETLGVAMVGVILFLSAGSLSWPMGWILVGITLVWVAATAFVLITKSPELIAERLGPKKGAKGWDTAIMSTIGLTTLARLVVAGLDRRYGWSSGVALAPQVVAAVVVALAYALGVWAIASNVYFSQIVRIQRERGHAVATGGPYRLVRHPTYIGSILVELAVPLMLGSWWALIPGLVGAVLYVVRTALEDRTLISELDGNEAYASKVAYRLLPRVW